MLVTGATGFLGRHLLARLRQEAAMVAGLTRRPDARRRADPGVTWHRVDLEQAAPVAAALRQARPEIVFHLAGRVDLARSAVMTLACLRENALATAQLLWALAGQRPRPRAVIFTSTTEVYGGNPPPFTEEQPVDPPSPYAVSKVAAEHYCRLLGRAEGLPVAILRVATVYGPGQPAARLIPSVLRAMAGGRPLALTSGEQRRDFVYVADVVDALLRAARTPAAAGEIINIGAPEAVSVRDLVEALCRLGGSDWRPAFGRAPQRVGESPLWCTDIRKAARLLGWAPATSLEAGLRLTFAAWPGRRTAAGQRERAGTLAGAR